MSPDREVKVGKVEFHNELSPVHRLRRRLPETFLPLTPKGGAKMVEAPGVEPGSRNGPPLASTCLFRVLIYPARRPRTGSALGEFSENLAAGPTEQSPLANLLVLCLKCPVGTDIKDR